MGSIKRAVAMASAVAVVSTGLVATSVAVAQTDDGVCDVGVSWNNFEQPRWAATDRPNMEATILEGGGTFTDFDARLDSAQQQTDVETLINGGADVLILLAQNQDAALSAIEIAQQNDVPIIAYDRLIEDPSVLYITFDNVGVGRAQAESILGAVPSGNYVLIKGDPGDPNASTFLPMGWDQAGLADKVESGEITILADQFTDGWRTETAQNNMEAIIDAANADGVQIDAILAENDSTALGVVAALQAKGYDPVPVSGQDGDQGNLQNVAAGWQYVDVWKDSNQLGKVAGAAALQLCEGVAMEDLVIPEGLIPESVVPTAGAQAAAFETPGGNSVTSFILQPTPITQENLNLVVDAGWIAQDVLCEQATDAAMAAPICAE
ncbi:MAG: substrate-binding domain-containing protein [Chloroflexota bacterium]|jgi:D-xylose transport system substrate-binding protein